MSNSGVARDNGKAVTTAFDYAASASKWPRGRKLVTAVGTGAQEVESAGDEAAAKRARANVIDNIRQLMEDAGVTDPQELDKAEDIYEAVLQFLQNTDFNPNFLPPHKY